ncbi:hypothetical protein IMCC1989_2731 [gamma proteobacterium IMCC1989]|nr:hypothetical protein IMCC1989_2731 [gamma proteobacterium IMCC1989]
MRAGDRETGWIYHGLHYAIIAIVGKLRDDTVGIGGGDCIPVIVI